jgi:transglutaminase/protease-like cytokinesis protein 3
MKKNLMKHILILSFLLLFITNYSYSQSYAAVDNAIKNYPKSFTSPEKLAEKIKADFASDEEKARAIFTWIALNIRYDLNAYAELSQKPKVAYSFSSEEERINKEQKFRRDMANAVLRSKKGVCQDYTALFQTLCELNGIKCMTIMGTSKTTLQHIGKMPIASDHAWNAVRIGDKWRFVEPTWAAGMLNLESGKMMQQFNDAYFFTAPEVFFLNHFPDDKRQTMVDKTAEDFAALPLYYGRYLKSGYEFLTPENGIFSIKDTQSIAFSIADLPENDQVAYVFSNDDKGNMVKVERQGNESRFIIPITKRNRGYLTIFVNNESVVAYKIIP